MVPKLSLPGAAALVMDDEDQLLGLVTSENLSEFIMLRQIGQDRLACTGAAVRFGVKLDRAWTGLEVR